MKTKTVRDVSEFDMAIRGTTYSESPRTILIRVLGIVLMILVISSESMAISCSSSCTANDVRISNPRITDANGNAIGCQYNCTPGSVVNAYLTLDIVNGAAADRYNLYLFYDKFIGGVNQGDFSSCLTPRLDGKNPVPKVTVPISFICGKSLVLSNVLVSWSVKLKEADCVNRGCPGVPALCWRPGTDLAVRAPLVVNFDASTTCYCGDTLFTDQTTGGSGGYLYDWNFGDGSPHSRIKNPAHHFASSGDHLVTLNVTDSSGCTARRTKTVTVLENPTANFSVNLSTLCYRPGIPTAFDASLTHGGTPPYTFTWNFDDGGTGTGQIISHQYKDPGSYNVVLVATDANGCKGTVVKEIVIKDCDPPEISEVTTFATEICAGIAVTVSAKVVDYVGASSVTLNYRVGGVLKTITMGFDTGSVKEGYWRAEIPGQSAGTTVTYWIKVSDGTYVAESANYTVTWQSCNPPEIQEVNASSLAPCEGSDVNVTAKIRSDFGIYSVILNYDGVNRSMSGPTGSTSGLWTASIPGSGKSPDDALTFIITATDIRGGVNTSQSYTITWKDCTSPAIETVSVSSGTPCAGDDVVLTAHITDDVGVNSVVVNYEGSEHLMTGPSGSMSGDWTFTIPGPGRSPGDILNFTIKANDSANNVAETTGQIVWRDCNAPDIQKVTLSSARPCAGSDVVVTAHVIDDHGVGLVTLIYDGTNVNMTGPTGSTEGNWTATILGSGKSPGNTISYKINALDEFDNSTNTGTLTITWIDCTKPIVAGLNVSTSTPCSGDDVTVTATLTDNVGVTSATLSYGGLSYSMTGPIGSKSGNWTTTIIGTDMEPGDGIEFTVTARDGAGNVVVSGTSSIEWIDCEPPSFGSIELSTNTPCAGDDVVVTVHVTDDVAVSSVVVNYEGFDHIMTGPSGSKSGDWTVTVPGSGRSPGDVLDFTIKANDTTNNVAETTGQIVWRDCDAPDIQTITLSPADPCTGSDVLVTVHIYDDHGIYQIVLIYDGTSVNMTGPTGSQEGDWTATISGSGKIPGDKITYEIDAVDSFGNSDKTGSFSITWIDCTAPVISEIIPGSTETCEIHGEDIEVSAWISSSNQIVSAILTYSDPNYPEDIFRVEMQQDQENPERWVAFLRADIDRTLTYTITVSDGFQSTTSEKHEIDILECDVPVILSHDILPPCAGEDAEISLSVRDEDTDAYRVTLYYDGQEHPLHLLGEDPFPLIGEWVGTIPGSGKDPNDSLSYYVNIYTLDTLGPNPGPFGPYSVSWKSCDPSLAHTNYPTTCAGLDTPITAHVLCPLGIKSVELYFTDPFGQYVESMVLEEGGDLTDGDWWGVIPSQPAGTVTSYYIIATNLGGHTARSPPNGAENYSITWQDCGAVSPINLTKSSSSPQVNPGEQFTYTITYENNVGVDLHDVVVREFYPSGAEFISASPPPTIGNDVWEIGTLPAGGPTGRIIITMQVPERANLVLNQEGEASGDGFVNIYKSISTERASYDLKNVVTLSTYEGFRATAIAYTTVGGSPGTSLKLKGHGSGTSESEDQITMMTENKSIQVNQSLSATYKPTTLDLYNNRTTIYSSKWTEESKAKNWVTGASMSESYRYATSIDRESRMFLDQNESAMETDSEFDGMGHLGFLKMPNNVTSKSTPIFESREDYAGSFMVIEKVDEYGSSVSSDKASSGTGLVAVDKRIGENQRSYESGAGTYDTEELIRTHTNYIAKEISLLNAPTNLSLTDEVSIDSSQKWKEGMYSKTPETSYIGEEYTSITSLDKETLAKGLNEMDTEAEFSGRARFRAVLEKNLSEPEVDFDEQYEGDYSIERRILFTGVPKYDRPHITVVKNGSLHEETILDAKDTTLVGESRDKVITVATYTITVENDGNKALGPIYVKDLFPPEAAYINSSVRPSELTDSYANWTLTHLAIGDVSTITLNLDVTKHHPDELVNRVIVTAGYNGDEQVTASNYTALEMEWLTCCLNETVSVTKVPELDEENPNVVMYRVDIKNWADVTRVATVTDSLPAGMVLIDSMVPFASYENNVVTWNLIEIGPFETVTIAYRVEAQRAGRFVNSVDVDARSVDGAVVQPVYASSVIDVGVVEECEATSCTGWQPPNWDFQSVDQTAELSCDELACEEK